MAGVSLHGRGAVKATGPGKFPDHDESILSVEVIARPASGLDEPEARVKPLGALVRNAHLEVHLLGLDTRGEGEDLVHERGSDALAAKGRRDGDLVDVNFASREGAEDITRESPSAEGHAVEAPGGPDLHFEIFALPRHRKRETFEARDSVEVGVARVPQRQWFREGAHPASRASSRARFSSAALGLP